MIIRGILLVIVGVGAAVNGILVFGKEPSAVEKTGWLYHNFGSNGISMGMTLLGVAMFLIGIFMVRHEWEKYRQKAK